MEKNKRWEEKLHFNAFVFSQNISVPRETLHSLAKHLRSLIKVSLSSEKLALKYSLKKFLKSTEIQFFLRSHIISITKAL